MIVLVGSPVADTDESLVQLAKRLKKNNVAVDVVNFGESEENEPKLAKFIETVNSNDNSRLFTANASNGLLSEQILTSPLIMGGDAEGGAGPSGTGGDAAGGLGVDPSIDPELAMVRAAT